MTSRFIIHTNPDVESRQKTHWVYQSGNGAVLCTSENIVNPGDALSTIQNMKRDIVDAPIFRQYGDEDPELVDAGVPVEPTNVETPAAMAEGDAGPTVLFKLMQGADMRWTAYAQLSAAGGIYFGPAMEDVNEVQAFIRALQAADVTVQPYTAPT